MKRQELERIPKINSAIKSLVKPWISLGIEPPTLLVIEIARLAGIKSSSSIAKMIALGLIYFSDNGSIPLKANLSGKNGETIAVGDIPKEARKIAPFKKVLKISPYRARDRITGPVIKRRIRTDVFNRKLTEVGTSRLRVALVPATNEKEANEKRRSAIKKRLGLKWQARSGSQEFQPEPISQATADQERLLVSLGLWATPDLRGKYSFRLSSEVLALSKAEQTELNTISDLIYSRGGFFDGAIRLFNQALNGNRAIYDILAAGLDKQELDLIDPVSLTPPFISRADLMRTADQKQLFQIAEIEGDKTHAFGYASILDLLRNQTMDRDDTPGIIAVLKAEIERFNLPAAKPIVLAVGNGEKFYIGELSVFAKLANEASINLIVLPEDDLEVDQYGIGPRSTPTRTDTVIRIPDLFFTPVDSSIKQRSALSLKLLRLHKQGLIRSFIPPGRFLVSKNLLALISNPQGDRLIESALNSCFDSGVIRGLRKFIPITLVINQETRDLAMSLLTRESDNWVIKQAISSGMKGVNLGRERRSEFIKRALTFPNQFVIQKKVRQLTKRFTFTEADDPRTIKEAEMYMRISPFFTKDGIATIGVTARETPAVHGAKDAIQIPVVFERQ